jgi:hypothetical protein
MEEDLFFSRVAGVEVEVGWEPGGEEGRMDNNGENDSEQQKYAISKIGAKT